jgi:alpha-N-arabinofuranosidase
MQHGPLLIANNIFLSRRRSLWFNATGIALAHNLLGGPFSQFLDDSRETPFLKAHATAIAGLATDAAGGDHRLINNLCAGGWNARAFDACRNPCTVAGSVYANGAQPSKFDTDALLKPDFDAGVKLTQKPDGAWYLTLREDPVWRTHQRRNLVTTDLLGKAKIPNLAYDNADGSRLMLDTDYFGKKRDANNPYPGPFEDPLGVGVREVRVWPK